VPVIENGPAHADLRDTLDYINNLDLDNSSRIRDDDKWVLNPRPQRPKDPFQERRQERRGKKRGKKDDPSSAGEAATGLSGVSGGRTFDKADPCAGVKASDLDYYKPRARENGVVENGIDHITRNHILLDGSKTDILTPSNLPIFAQLKSKYLFQEGTSLKDAQQSVIKFNAFLFDTAIATHNYVKQNNGNIVMSIRLTAPIRGSDGTIYAGLGYDKQSGWLPTMRAKLVLGPNCKEVVSSFPGK
jgi:hypothetical protein